MHDPGAGALGRGVVAQVHQVDELRLAGEVDVVGAGLGAGGDQRLAVADVRADGGDHHPRRLGEPAQRGRRRVGVAQLDAGRVDPRRAGRAARSSLAAVAPGERPAQLGGRVRGQVLGGEAAGEPGGAEQDDVQVASL